MSRATTYFLALLDGVVRAFQAMRGRCPRPRARRSRDRAHRPVSGLPGGAAMAVAMVAVKADADRFGYAAPAGGAGLAGAWAGEIVFLVMAAAYVAGILAVTARRPPAGPAALVSGTGAGVLAGLIMYVL